MTDQFSSVYDGIDFKDSLKSIPAGTVVYKVYGLDAPSEMEGKEFFIGDLVLTTAPVTSRWADEDLFFRH